MTRLRGHFDGKAIVLDDPPPPSLKADTKVEVVIRDGGERPLQVLLELASPGGLPPDFAAQHEHYVRGTPKR